MRHPIHVMLSNTRSAQSGIKQVKFSAKNRLSLPCRDAILNSCEKLTRLLSELEELIDSGRQEELFHDRYDLGDR